MRLTIGKRTHFSNEDKPLCGATRQGAFGKVRLTETKERVTCKRCKAKLEGDK